MEHGDIETQLKRLNELETQVEVHKGRAFDLEKMVEKQKKDFELERSRLAEEVDIEREKVL